MWGAPHSIPHDFMVVTFGGNVMKTREEIETLKAQWKSDPAWDIEQTEGFAEYEEELFLYRKSCESEWSRQRAERLFKKSDELGVPGNLSLAAYVEQLENRINELDNIAEQILPTVR